MYLQLFINQICTNRSRLNTVEYASIFRAISTGFFDTYLSQTTSSIDQSHEDTGKKTAATRWDVEEL